MFNTSASGSAPPPPAPSPPNSLEWFKTYFRLHFNEWIFGPIDRLVYSRDALVGFIFMSCTIDYLGAFYTGSYEVKYRYIKFVDDYFPKNTDGTPKYNSADLYDSLRNGLVHMFTIKGKKYTLTHIHPENHFKRTKTGEIVLNAADFRNDLFGAAQKFFDDLEACPTMLKTLTDWNSVNGFMDLEELELV